MIGYSTIEALKLAIATLEANVDALEGLPIEELNKNAMKLQENRYAISKLRVLLSAIK